MNKEFALAEFAELCFQSAWEGNDVDGGDIQEWGVQLGLLVETKYDPKKHGPSEYDLEPGDTYYVFSDWFKEARK